MLKMPSTSVCHQSNSKPIEYFVCDIYNIYLLVLDLKLIWLLDNNV